MPKNKYDIHPDFLKFNHPNPPMYPTTIKIVNKVIGRMTSKVKLPYGLTEVVDEIKGFQDQTIKISIISPKELTDNEVPALVYYHGGGFALKASPMHKQLAYDYALKTPCKVFFVEYRLVPDHCFPVGLEDCFAAYQWVCNNAEDLGVNGEKIAVGGDSAGGNLATSVCLLARDRNMKLPILQMLIYPVVDETQQSKSMQEFDDTPLWNSKLNEKMWSLYLKNGSTLDKGYASPLQATLLSNLPTTYLEVAEFDCLRDEGIDYAKKLEASGVEVELIQTKRTVHGFEIARDNEIVKDCINRRVNALKKIFGI